MNGELTGYPMDIKLFEAIKWVSVIMIKWAKKHDHDQMGENHKSMMYSKLVYHSLPVSSFYRGTVLIIIVIIVVIIIV